MEKVAKRRRNVTNRSQKQLARLLRVDRSTISSYESSIRQPPLDTLSRIAACERGEYDLIVTKSVSRFARNLVDCISLIRKLKNLSPPVDVFFEMDHLNTLGKDSELMLTFLASIAQEESVKKREAMVWSLAQRFKDRKLLTPPPLGYDRQRDAAGNYIKYAPLVVNEAEAKVVRFIFDAYLHGWSQADIADFLTDIGCRTKTGSTDWNSGSIGYILTNERYCGDVLTWKTFTSDLFEHKRRKNRQDLDQYHYLDQHEAIVSRETFEMVQALLQNRKHHIRGGLPSLQVIDGGVFRGFVPINHHWVNDDPGLYYDAYNSVKGPDRKTRVRKSTFSAFDLEGYQVVRSQFLQARYEGPAMTVSRDRITFNLFCMRRFADIAYIQLLLHPAERKADGRRGTGSRGGPGWISGNQGGAFLTHLRADHYHLANPDQVQYGLLAEVSGCDPYSNSNSPGTAAFDYTPLPPRRAGLSAVGERRGRKRAL